MILQELLVPLKLVSDQFNSGIDKAMQKGNSLMGGLSAIGGVATAAIAGTAVAAGALLASTIKPASDLNESMNAVNVVFKEGASLIHEYGKQSASMVGLSTAKFNQLSSVTGAFLTNLGFDSEGAAQKTIELTERAADMASVFNTDVDTALAAIQSGLKGEFNPLEQFGVKMNAASIEAKAMAMGLADANGELSDSAKAQASLALIMEQTNKVAGDFRNTSDGWANFGRVFSATTENIKAKVGSALLPALSALGSSALKIIDTPKFQGMIDGLIGGLTKFSDWLVTNIPVWIANFGKFTSWLANNKPIVVGVLAALGVAVLAFGVTVATAAWTALAPMLPVIAVMALVGAAVYLLYRAWTENWGGIQEKTATFFTWLKSTWDRIWNALLPVFQLFWTQIKTIWEAFSAAFNGDWYTFGVKMREAWDRAWNTIKAILSNAWSSIKTTVGNLIASVIEKFRNTDWKQVGKDILRGIINGLESLRQWAINTIISIGNSMLDAFTGFFGIQSPSKLMEDMVGKNLALGIDKGFTENMNLSPVSVMGNVSSISSAFSQKPATQPTSSVAKFSDAQLDKLVRMFTTEIAKITN